MFPIYSFTESRKYTKNSTDDSSLLPDEKDTKTIYTLSKYVNVSI